ncbi:MAG: hypothetical protein OQK78_03015, partial [Gammaproteobacteria bacterium]|nr:hypothetical protein [Gammaproteobacteria bacterium]
MSPSKKKKLSAEELTLFQSAVYGVIPLEQNRVPPFKQKPLARLLHSAQEDERYRDNLFSDGLAWDHEREDTEPKEQLLFHRSGLQRA